MHFQWYPGHMTKAKRMMQENIKLVDLVIELTDARIPLASRNPDIDELGKNKARLILLNKADLAEDRYNDLWIEYFRKKGFMAVKVNSQKGTGIKSIQDVKPSGSCDGGRDSQRRKINLYQLTGGESLCENRKQAGCDKGKAVDPAE